MREIREGSAVIRNRPLCGILLLTASLQIVGMVRNPLPAQDGLKFIRIAREFGLQPWADVIRSADQHPLYPALIAAAHPIVIQVLDDGPASWRIAAQSVSMLAMLAMIVPYHAFAREMVGRRAAILATLVFPTLPLMRELGHETLSDATALLGIVGSLALGLRALKSRRVLDAVGAGFSSGIGYFARPEAALPGGVLVATFLGLQAISYGFAMAGGSRPGKALMPTSSATSWCPMALAFAVAAPLLLCIGFYASLKGTVSEKISMRLTAGLGDTTGVNRSVPHWLPSGLDDPRWDFSPKEEADAPGQLTTINAIGLVMKSVSEVMVWVLIPFACWGTWATRRRDPAWWSMVGLTALFLAILTRHAMMTGYLSDRHCAIVAVVAIPWSAAGMLRAGAILTARRQIDPERRRRLAMACLGSLTLVSLGLQLKPGHPSRWGHQEAGRWLANQAAPGEAVLDTRGWAAFISGLRSYDPWHLRQAITDASLGYIVIGEDELTAGSRRAATLKALLNYAAVPVAAFPSREGDDRIGVRVYRYRRPDSWEGIVR